MRTVCLPKQRPARRGFRLSLTALAAGFTLNVSLSAPSAMAQPLHAAVLPSQAPHFNYADRAQPGRVFYATLLNDSDQLLQNCRVELAAELPFILDYQVTERTQNRPVGPANTPAVISPRGSQTFSFRLRMSRDTYVAPQQAGFRFVCDGVAPASIVSGINTVLLSAGTPPTPGLLSALAVASESGVLMLDTGVGESAAACQLVRYPGGPAAPCAIGAYAFALLNTRQEVRELDIVETSGMYFSQVCRTDSAGMCTTAAAPQSQLQTRLEPGELATFSAYLVSLDDFAFNPFIEFQSAGFEVYERSESGPSVQLAEERVRVQAPAFEWSARLDEVTGNLHVRGSMWVPSGCHRAVLTPVFDSELPANELHLELRASPDQLPPDVSCGQAVAKSLVSYSLDSTPDGYTQVIVRSDDKRLTLAIES